MVQEIKRAMTSIPVKIYNRSKNPLPALQSAGASGYDLYADLSEPAVLQPGEVYRIPTGIFIEVPLGYEAQVRARSGLAARHGIILVNGIGTIDADYRGEIQVIMMNLKQTPYTVEPGERVAQMVFAPVVTAAFEVVDTPEALAPTERADGGFGHTGR